MRTIKPSRCVGCPRYRNKMVVGVGSKDAHILFLLESPVWWADSPLDGNYGDLLRGLLHKVRESDSDSKMALEKVYFMYSLACGDKEGKPSIKLVTQCRDNVGGQQLVNIKPQVVVAMGAKTLGFLNISGLHKNNRGVLKDIVFSGHKMKVITTFSLAQLSREPGLAFLMMQDIKKATKVVAKKLNKPLDIDLLKAQYDIPTNIEEVVKVVEEYTKTTDLLALDFETNSLYAWADTSKVIAISGAMAPGKAFSIYVDHKKSPYSFAEVIPWVWKILQSRNPKAWWNYKFDMGFAWYPLVRQTKEAIGINPELKGIIEKVVGKTIEAIYENPVINTKWDGMLAEHMLDESKKGHYSLKSVLLDAYPELGGYEAELHKEKEDIDSNWLAAKQEAALASTGGVLETQALVKSGSCDEQIDAVKLTLKGIRKKLKSKKTPEAHKPTLTRVNTILTNRIKYLKKVKSQTKKLVSSLASLRGSTTYNNPKHRGATFEDVNPEVMMPYAAIDADLTRRLSVSQRSRIWKEDPASKAKSEGRDYMLSLMDKHYLPLTTVLMHMQVEGIRLDRKFLLEAYNELLLEGILLKKGIEAQIMEDLGYESDAIVLNNPVALGNLMVGGYGMPVLKRTDKGEVSSDNEVMQKWGETNKIAKDIVRYRKVVKARSTYIYNLLTLSDYDGRVHGNVSINGTATGRLSCSYPNLQNQPVSIAGVLIKKAFICTDTDYTNSFERGICEKYGWEEGLELCVVDLDFAGAEVRGLTTYAQDPALLDALNKGLDMHSWVASMVFNESYEAINKARAVESKDRTEEESRLVTKRQHAKAVVFGMLFCISARKLAMDLEIPIEEAEHLMSAFYNRFPKIRDYIEGTKARVLRDNILRTPTGRARRFPLANVGGSIGASCGRQGVNFLVQGFTSEVVNRVLINISKHIKSLRGRLMITVHDSIVFEMPRKDLCKLDMFLKEHVRDFISKEFPMIPVELPYDVEVGPTYGEAKQSVDSYKF